MFFTPSISVTITNEFPSSRSDIADIGDLYIWPSYFVDSKKNPSEYFKDVEKLTEVTSRSFKTLKEQFNKDKILQELNRFKSNKIDHIINGSKLSNHKWEKLVSDKNWSKIRNIIIEVLETGQEEIYKSGTSKVKMINDNISTSNL